MPNWENEIKNAIYEESLEGEEKNNFLLIMNLLNGRTPQEYITGIDAKIKKTEQEKAVIGSRINVAQEKIDYEYDAKVKEVNNAYVEEVANISEDAPRLASLKDSLDKQSKMWDVEGMSIEEMWDNVSEYDDEYKKAPAYEGLLEYQKMMFDSYYNTKNMYNKFPNKEAKLNKIAIAKENREKALNALGNKPTVQMDLLKKNDSLGEDIKNYEDNKKTIEEFEKNQYKQMQNVKIDGLSNAAKEKGLDLLLQARIDYQTKLNGFERLLANILPTWMYPNGKYVDRINSYKKSLKEVGFSDDEIKKAAPDKDATYIYDEETKTYDRLVRDNLDVLSEETVVKYDEPEKQQVRQQPKEFMENLADQTVDNKGAVVNQKVELNNNDLVKDDPQVGGNLKK